MALGVDQHLSRWRLANIPIHSNGTYRVATGFSLRSSSSNSIQINPESSLSAGDALGAQLPPTQSLRETKKATHANHFASLQDPLSLSSSSASN